MLEVLEQLTPPVQQILEDPDLAVAGVTAGSIAVYAFVAEGGAIKAEYEISDLNQAEISERREELAAEIETDSFLRETYNRFTKPWTDGKLSAYEEANETYSTYNPKVEDPEYFNQIYTDDELEEEA